MSNENMRYWQAMARPPVAALKTIKGGRLSGMTDVNPQWRYQAMTEQFGACGTGWKYTIDKLWTEPGCDGEILAFAQVSLLTREVIGPNGSHRWSEPIVGIGGNHMVVKETKGLRNNDECWKMAVTDALSVAMKMLGVAADIYAGLWDGSKYSDSETPRESAQKASNGNGESPAAWDQQWNDLVAVAENGKSALDAAWAQCHPEFKNHVVTQKRQAYADLKTKAGKVRTQ